MNEMELKLWKWFCYGFFVSCILLLLESFRQHNLKLIFLDCLCILNCWFLLNNITWASLLGDMLDDE